MISTLVAIAILQLARVLLHNLPTSHRSARGRNVLRVLLGAAFISMGAAVITVLPVAAPVFLLVVVLFVAPWLLTRFVLVPLGLARASYWVARLADVTFALDPHGGAAAAAAWALCRQRKVDDETLAWLEGKLDAQSPLRGAGVLASGLVLSARGDLDGARALITAALGVDSRACPPVARRLAVGWLSADAARRGEWARVAELGHTPSDGGLAAWLLSAIAEALLLEPMAPGELGLWMRWALAPHRARTLPLVRRAIEASRGTFIEPQETLPVEPRVVNPGTDPIQRALALHASVVAMPPTALTARDVRAAAAAWDAVLEGRATERLLADRAAVIGASDARGVLAKTRSAVEDDLAAVVLTAGMPIVALDAPDAKGEFLRRVKAILRDRLLAEVEAAADTIKRRALDKRALPGPSEWREWLTVCDVYERAVRSGGAELRRLAFVKVYPDATSFAVWLYNDRHERPLANVVFRWLLAEATALDDTRAVTLMTKNVECGI